MRRTPTLIIGTIVNGVTHSFTQGNCRVELTAGKMFK
jgi:hypothetical protein